MLGNVAELTRLIEPVSTMLANGLMRLGSGLYNMIVEAQTRRADYELMKIAKQLQVEYPNETVEHVAYMLKKGSANA